MKKYEYVNVKIGGFIGANLEDHRAIINEYATKGYKFVTFIPTKIADNGQIRELDLVFETDC